jgi:hypothetical protein
MFKKILPIVGIVFLGALIAARTDFDEKLIEDVEPLLMKAAKLKEVLKEV